MHIARSTFPYAAVLLALLLIGLTHPVKATIKYIFFPRSATISSPVRGCAVIGYSRLSQVTHNAQATSPTVILLDGGTISTGLDTYGKSVLNVKGGGVSGILNAFDNSTVTISGGYVSSVFAFSHSTININGGNFRNVLAVDNCTVNVKGGNIKGILYARDNAALNLLGTNLSKTLVTDRSNDASDSKYILSGTLSDGTSIYGKSLYVRNGAHTKISLTDPLASSQTP